MARWGDIDEDDDMDFCYAEKSHPRTHRGDPAETQQDPLEETRWGPGAEDHQDPLEDAYPVDPRRQTPWRRRTPWTWRAQRRPSWRTSWGS